MANNKTKELYYSSELTEDMIRLGRDDLPYFAEHILGITLHEGQKKAWDKTSKKYLPVNIYLCGNRSGKTVYIACKHIWKLFYKKLGPGKSVEEKYWDMLEYRTMNCAPHTNQTKIIMRHIMMILRGQFAIRDTESNKVTTNKCLIRYFIDDDSLNNPQELPKTGPYELHFANRSSYYSFTLGGSHGDAIQGEAYMYGSYDEFGRSKAPDKEFDDITTRLGDWMAEFDIITTPDETNPDASDFLSAKSELAQDESTGFRIINWSTRDNPHMDERSIGVLLTGKTEEAKRRILEGNVVRPSTRFFGYRKIGMVFDEKRMDLKTIDFVNHFPDPARIYSGGLDTAGLGKDSWSLSITDVTSKPFKRVFKYTSKDATPSENIAETRRIISSFLKLVGYQNFSWLMDATSEGGTIVYDALRDLDPIPFKFGIEKGTGKNMKFELLHKFRDLINEEAFVSFMDSSLHSQLTMYRGPKDDKGQATDVLMGAALSVYLPYLSSLEEEEELIVDIG